MTPSRVKSFLAFFLAALKNPLQVSTLFATGRNAAHSLTSRIPENPDGVIVELGVGTGAITEAIVDKVGRTENYLGVELNPAMIEFAKERFPDLRFVNASAEHFIQFLEGRPVAAVVSTLPWSLMPENTVTEILQSVRNSLAPDGIFATYMTMHVLKTQAGRRFQGQLTELFENLDSEVVLENLPPAKIFIARK